jgi:nucleoside-diphosphate-sugar epimerase
VTVRTKAIVFGGAGFIGCHLLRRLDKERRYEKLFCIDVQKPRFVVPGVQYIDFDIRESIPDLCGAGPFEIFNLAAVHTTPGHDDWEYYWTNVKGATNICKFASDVDADYVLFTSTMMVYGPTEAPKDEDALLEPVNAYGRSKILAEDIHRLWQHERFMDWRNVATLPVCRALCVNAVSCIQAEPTPSRPAGMSRI